MSTRTFNLPDLGEGLTDAEIISWSVAVGDEVVVDQIIATVETAKAQVELPCPYAGVVATLHGEPGQVIDVGAPFVTVRVGAERLHGPAPTAAGPAASDASVGSGGAASAEAEEGSGNVLIGYGTSSAGGGRRRRVRSGRPSGPTASPSQASTVEPVGSRPGPAIRVISPLVRRLAAEAGLDLHSVHPSAPGGIITKRDVVAALDAAASRQTPAGAEPAVGAGQTGDRPQRAARADDRVPMTGIRRTIAERLSRSRQEVPDATTWVDVDASGLRSLRDDLRAVRADAGIGYLALLARIVVAGLTRFPELNARVDKATREGEPDELVRLGSIHLSLAMQGPRGLVVPVVRDAQAMSSAELAAALRDLTERARLGTLAPTELVGGTFTLNNYGVYGVDGSTPIINYPEAGMLGVGRIIDKPWVVDGRLCVRPVTQLSLTFDHRVCDGGVAGGFLRYVADCVEHPSVLLADL